MAQRDELLAKYATSLAKRLRLQQRTTVVTEDRTVNVVVFSAELLDQVADKLEQLAHKQPPIKPRRRQS